jgi:hypothetical protein
MPHGNDHSLYFDDLYSINFWIGSNLKSNALDIWLITGLLFGLIELITSSYVQVIIHGLILVDCER